MNRRDFLQWSTIAGIEGLVLGAIDRTNGRAAPAPAATAHWDDTGLWSSGAQGAGGIANLAYKGQKRGGSAATLRGPGKANFTLRFRYRATLSEQVWTRLHVDLLGVRQDEHLTLSFLSHTPEIVDWRGKDGTVLTDMGGFPVMAAGMWYAFEIQSAGDRLRCRAWNEAHPDADTNEVWLRSPMPRSGDVRFAFYHAAAEAVESRIADVRYAANGEGSVASSQPHRTATELTLVSERARVQFDPTTGTLEIEDRRGSRRWRTFAGTGTAVTISDAQRADEKTMLCGLDTPAGPAHVRIELFDDGIPEPEVRIALEPAGEPQRRATVEFPSPLMPSEARCEWVLPAGEGVLVSADEPDRPGLLGSWTWSQRALLMPWYGLLAADGQVGVMVEIDTPDDWRLFVRKVRGDDGRERAAAAVQWLTSLKRQQPVAMRFRLFDQGGYVAMAKAYRRTAIAAGRLRTVEEKSRTLPQIKQLAGAVDVFEYVDARRPQESVVHWLIQSGVRRALYTVMAESGSPSIDTIKAARIKQARAAGYVTSDFDGYFDIYSPELVKLKPWAASMKESLVQGYPDEVIVNPNRSLMLGWPNPVGKETLPDGTTRVKVIPGLRRCSATFMPWLERCAAPDIARFDYRARFIDVMTANPLWECWSTKHPETRTQDRKARRALFEWLTAKGLISGSEGGADWANDLIAWQEGSLTLPRLASWNYVYPGGTPVKMPKSYADVQFDPALRVPLRELVYHDAMFITWRWEQTPDRWGQPVYWRKWDLMHLINAQMPIFVFHPSHTAVWTAADKQRVLQTIHDVCGFNEKVGGVEMTDHHFLSPDRAVQESRFANGWAVIVNFSESTPFTPGGEAAAGGAIEPLGFRTYRYAP